MSRRARGRGGDFGHEDGALGVHLSVRRGRWAAYNISHGLLADFYLQRGRHVYGLLFLRYNVMINFRPHIGRQNF